MDWGTAGTIFGIIGVIMSAVFAYVAFRRNKEKDDEGQGQQLGTIQSDLGYVKSGIVDGRNVTKEQIGLMMTKLGGGE
jgi:hypothetical protein